MVSADRKITDCIGFSVIFGRYSVFPVFKIPKYLSNFFSCYFFTSTRVTLSESIFYFYLSKKIDVYFYFYSSNEPQFFEQVCPCLPDTHCYILPLMGECLPVYDEVYIGRSINFLRTCISHSSTVVRCVANYGIFSRTV